MIVKKIVGNYMFYGIIAAIIILDQGAKRLVRTFALQDVVIIPRVLSLTNVANTGASFGMFRGMNTLLIVVSVCIITFLFYYIFRHRDEPVLFFGLIIGGALSNLLDRLTRGFVTDFIQIPFWPAFNFADTAITIGVIAVIISNLKQEKMKRTAKNNN